MSSKPDSPQELRRAEWLARCIIGVACVASIVYAVYALHRQVTFARQTVMPVAFTRTRHQALQGQTTSTHAFEPTQVEPWMTFGYIQTVYKVPAEVVQSQLPLKRNVSERMSLYQYARLSGMNAQTLVSMVQYAIFQYRTTHPPSK